MDLFQYRESRALTTDAPLAARMRPRNLGEYVGQSHIMAPGRLLRRAIEADRLTSLIFYGPPGTGKTTLARVIAHHTRASFQSINAVLAGVKDLREAIAAARKRRGEAGLQTVLFVDEVHRFNKAQQDALLPWVERGTIILIGATTENPYFEVNKALVSRSRVFQLRSLTEEELSTILDNALRDRERGYGHLDVRVSESAREHLVSTANGDARALLGALELAVETTSPNAEEQVLVTLAVAEESIQERAVLYDKEGDAHFDVISAFIKSLRGSDPDASLYWLARMVYAGENPRFILRRLLIFAGEDVGMAMPEAVSIVNACAQAFDRVGMPEGRYHLAQATLCLATAPKSNSTMGFFDALKAVKNDQDSGVPIHLKDPSRDGDTFGHGKGYLYPHAYRDHWVAQQYLPTELQGRLFYNPSHQGYEASIYETVHRRRDAQLAAMVDRDALGVGPREIFTTSPKDPALDRWIARTVGGLGEQISQARDLIFEKARLQRHHVVLDLRAGTGLLTWEAIRKTPEGGTYARCVTREKAESLQGRARTLNELRQPEVFSSSLETLVESVHKIHEDLRFDRILARNGLVSHPHKAEAARDLLSLLLPEGEIVLLESLPGETQRLYHLVPEDAVEVSLLERWKTAEEAIYQDKTRPMLSWGPDDLVRAFEEAGGVCSCEIIPQSAEKRISPALVKHWFSGEEGSYVHRLQSVISDDEAKTVEKLLQSHVAGEVVTWTSAMCALHVKIS